MKITSRDLENAQTVFDFFRKETDCFLKHEQWIVCPHFVVALGDDALSVFNAVYIMESAYLQFHKMPKLLCLGGIGKNAKYLHRYKGETLSAATSLWMISKKAGSYPYAILDKGNDLLSGLKELVEYLKNHKLTDAVLIFCPTQRMSKVLERMVAHVPSLFENAPNLKAYYYVENETVQEMRSYYNGMAVAKGLPLLREAARLYDFMMRQSGVTIASLDYRIEKSVVDAGEELLQRYPAKFSLKSLYQEAVVKWNLRKDQAKIAQDLDRRVYYWQKLYSKRQ